MSPYSTIYIRTYPPDHPWLKWSLASIERFWADDSRIIVNCEPGYGPEIKAMAPSRNVEITEWVQWGNNKGYIAQQYFKMIADTLTDSEWIVFMDSDLIINRTIGLADFMDGDKKRVRWFYEPYSSVTKSEPGATRWLSATWRAFNIRPEYEYMRRHPFIVHRDTLSGCRQYLEGQHGPLADYLLNLPGMNSDIDFSEFNCLGFYAWLFNADKYWFLDVTQHQKEAGTKYWTPGTALDINPVDQHHSWTGDPEQAHGRFLQACEAADFHLNNARLAHAKAGGIRHPSPETESGVQEVGEMVLPLVSKTGDAGSIPAPPVENYETIPNNEPAAMPVDADLPPMEPVHADICLGMERTGAFAADQKPVTIIEDPFEQDLAKAGFVKTAYGETYEKLPTDSVPAGESL